MIDKLEFIQWSQYTLPLFVLLSLILAGVMLLAAKLYRRITRHSNDPFDLLSWQHGPKGVIGKGSTFDNVIIKSGANPQLGQLIFFPEQEQVTTVVEICTTYLNEKKGQQHSFKVLPHLFCAPSEGDTFDGGVSWQAHDIL